MPFVVLLIGVILIVVAFNNSFSQLASELESDIPGYFKWAAAIVAILGLGYIPGFRTPSRWLLALVLLVIVLKQGSAITQGLQSFFASSGAATSVGQGQANPSASYVATYAPAASGSSTTATASAAPVLTAAQQLAANPLNPNAYVGLAAGFGGLS